MTDKEQYEICKVRKHQKSGKTMTNDSKGAWEICEYCKTWFRYITKTEESNVPKI